MCSRVVNLKKQSRYRDYVSRRFLCFFFHYDNETTDVDKETLRSDEIPVYLSVRFVRVNRFYFHLTRRILGQRRRL